jgi:hypothetical protein
MFPDGANEHPVVRALSENGKYLVPSDFSANLPFFHHLPIPDGYEFKQNRNVQKLEVKNKIYIAGIYSDGDNIQYVWNFMRTQFWHSTARATNPVPIAYEISPSLSWIAPYMLYYFYSQATPNDYFVPGVGGNGYVKTTYMTDNFFKEYYTDTARLMRLCDMQEMRSWDTPIEKMIDTMNPQGEPPSISGNYDGYGGGSYDRPYVMKNVAVSQMLSFSNDYNDEYQKLQTIKSLQDGPMFVVFHLICWEAPYAKWVEFCQNITQDETFEVVRLDQMTEMILSLNQLKNLPEFIFLWALIVGMVVLYIFSNQIKRKFGIKSPNGEMATDE